MPVTQSPPVPLPVVRDASAFVRALVVSARTWRMYSPEHPNAARAVERLRQASTALLATGDVVVGFAAETVLANGQPLPDDTQMAEAARLMHGHDILCVRVIAPPSQTDVSDFLRLVAMDPERLRASGGTERVWQEFRHRSIEVQAINYDALLADRPQTSPGPAQATAAGLDGESARKPPEVPHDAIWQEIVRSLSAGRPASGLSVQQRLVEVAQSPSHIAALTDEVLESDPAGGPSTMVAAQAATVLMTYQRLVRAVEAQAPEQVAHALQNVAAASEELDPVLVMRAVAESAESGLGSEVTSVIGRWFDDERVAHMLAASLAAEGKATGRIAAAVHTLVPDAGRRHRVLTLARGLTPHSHHDAAAAFEATLQALEQMLTGPSDAVYTSQEYASSLDSTDERSYEFSLSTPAQMDAWIRTVSSASVERLSVTLLLDLLALDPSADAAADTADAVAALAESLLPSSDLRDVERIVSALDDLSQSGSPEHRLAADRALHTVARSGAFREAATSLADYPPDALDGFERMCARLGPRCLESLAGALPSAPDDEGRQRIEAILLTFGDAAVAPLAQLFAAQNWPVCRAAIHAVGRIGTPSAAAVLQTLVAGSDGRRAKEATIALMRMDTADAADGVAALLRDRACQHRDVLVDGVAASHAPSAGRLLSDALDSADLLGTDHELALHLLGAIRLTGQDDAVPAVVRAAGARRWWAWQRSAKLARTAVSVLASMRAPSAAPALEAAAFSGPRSVRRLARRAMRGGA